jgi:hypothetical protein
MVGGIAHKVMKTKLMSVRREEPFNTAAALRVYAKYPHLFRISECSETAFCLSSQTFVTCLVAGTPMQTEEVWFSGAGL